MITEWLQGREIIGIDRNLSRVCWKLLLRCVYRSHGNKLQCFLLVADHSHVLRKIFFASCIVPQKFSQLGHLKTHVGIHKRAALEQRSISCDQVRVHALSVSRCLCLCLTLYRSRESLSLSSRSILCHIPVLYMGRIEFNYVLVWITDACKWWCLSNGSRCVCHCTNNIHHEKASIMFNAIALLLLACLRLSRFHCVHCSVGRRSFKLAIGTSTFKLRTRRLGTHESHHHNRVSVCPKSLHPTHRRQQGLLVHARCECLVPSSSRVSSRGPRK